MIRINICMDDLTMDVEGHAYAQEHPGEPDLVCCAVSTVTQGLIYCLEEMQDQRDNVNRMDIDMDKGRLHLHAVPREWGRPAVRRRFEIARSMLRMLQERYPEYIEITEGD